MFYHEKNNFFCLFESFDIERIIAIQPKSKRSKSMEENLLKARNGKRK